jgi:pimeloyl-ACP methyl ester carboxylesterase
VPETPVRLEVRDESPIDIPGDGLVAHWYRPGHEGPRASRGVLILPIQGGDYEISTAFAEFFASQGYHALRVERRAEWLNPTVSFEVMTRLVPQFVSDIRKMLDHWLAQDGAPDGERVGLFGVSMGTMTGVLLAATEPRIHRAVYCIGGGELSDIIIDGRDKELDAWRDDMVQQLGGRESFDRLAREQVRQLDILGHAGRIDTSRVLYVAARFDRVVPWSASVRLWEALGKPKRRVVPTGHYSAILALPLIKRWSTAWLDAGW